MLVWPGDRDGDVLLESDLDEGVTPADTSGDTPAVLAVSAGEYCSVDCASAISFSSTSSNSSSSGRSCELRVFGFAVAVAADGSPFLPASKRLTRKAR